MLSILLLIAIATIGTEIYLLWRKGPWQLPNPGKTKSLTTVDSGTAEVNKPPLVGTEIIISKNLFDPERGEGRSREAEASSSAFQRIRGMVLLGTAILGGSQYAVLRDQVSTGVQGQVAAGQAPNVMRLRLGDEVEGFKLSDIGDKRVVFSRGATRVEIVLDYFRKPDLPAPRLPTPGLPRRVEPGPPRTPVPVPGRTAEQGGATVPVPGQVGVPRPVAPRVIPSLPRRERIPLSPRNPEG